MDYFKSLNSLKYKKFLVMIATSFSMVLCLPLSASHSNHADHRFDTDSRLSGNSLEHDLWLAVQNHNNSAIEDLISPMFLGSNMQGSRNHDTEIANLKNMSIDSYTISNMIESQDDDIRIISYDFAATGPNATSEHRISIWQRKKHKHHQFFWQLISQSNFSLAP